MFQININYIRRLKENVCSLDYGSYSYAPSNLLIFTTCAHNIPFSIFTLGNSAFLNNCVFYQPILLQFALLYSKSVACLFHQALLARLLACLLCLPVCLSVCLSFFWPLSYADFRRKLHTPVNCHPPLLSNIRH